jgi:hypothetical protein
LGKNLGGVFNNFLENQLFEKKLGKNPELSFVLSLGYIFGLSLGDIFHFFQKWFCATFSKSGKIYFLILCYFL